MQSFFKNDDSSLKPMQICIPLTGSTPAELQAEIRAALFARADILEWRVDKLSNISINELEITLETLSALAGATPLLFTWRSHRDGGRYISDKDYVELLTMAIKSGNVPLVDVEYSLDNQLIRQLIETAREWDVETVFSYHDFTATPERIYIIEVLNQMKRFGADVCKVAFMPGEFSDVLNLMSSIDGFAKANPQLPVIGIAMGRLGRVTRVCGDLFGSRLTFATVTNGSAPGQLSVEELRQSMQLLGCSPKDK